MCFPLIHSQTEMGRGRAPCCAKVGLKKGPWTASEDMRLISHIQKFGHGNWRALPKQAGLLRCGKSCRLRWINYLRPDIKRGNFTPEEEETIIQLHALLGNKWSKIASRLPGRTDNEIKNVWNTHLKKRLVPKGTGPSRVEPKQSSSSSSSADSCLSNSSQDDGLSHEEKLHPTFDSESRSKTSSKKEMVKNPELLDEIIEIPIEPNSDFWDMLHEDSSNMSESHESKATPSRYESKQSSSSSSSSSYLSTSNQVHEGLEEQAHTLFKFQRVPEVKPILYEENNQDHSEEIDETPLDPNVDFWDMDYDLSFFAPSVGQVEEQESHQNQSLGEGMKADAEPRRRITYLENELELWEPIDQYQQSLVNGSSEPLLSFSPYDGTLDVEFDPVGAYFQMRSPTIMPMQGLGKGRATMA